MNEIIWDPAALDDITVRLRRAAQALDECRDVLSAIRAEEESVIGGNDGVSRRIIESTASAVRRTAEAAERSEALAGAMSRVTEMFRNTESAVAGLFEEKEKPSPFIRVVPSPSPFLPLPRRTMVAPLTLGETATPDWLVQAAAAAFDTTGA